MFIVNRNIDYWIDAFYEIIEMLNMILNGTHLNIFVVNNNRLMKNGI